MTATENTRRILSHEVRPDMLIQSGATGRVYRVLFVDHGWITLRRIGNGDSHARRFHAAELAEAGITLIEE